MKRLALMAIVFSLTLAVVVNAQMESSFMRVDGEAAGFGLWFGGQTAGRALVSLRSLAARTKWEV